MLGFKRPKKKELKNENRTEFEKGDVSAIIIAAFMAIMPTVILILAFGYLVVYLLFLR